MKRQCLILFLSFSTMFLGAITPLEAQIHGDTQISKHRMAKKERRIIRRKVRRRVSRRAHYRYARLPGYGVRLTTLPTGSIVIRQSNVTYHYHRGVFYTPRGNKFVVAKPAIGVRIRQLPPKHVRVVVPGGIYFYYYGTYYKKVGSEFVVTTAPKDALVDAIPEGYDVVMHRGTEYYVWDDVYYQEVETGEFEEGVGYQVVSPGFDG